MDPVKRWRHANFKNIWCRLRETRALTFHEIRKNPSNRKPPLSSVWAETIRERKQRTIDWSAMNSLAMNLDPSMVDTMSVDMSSCKRCSTNDLV